MNTICLGKNNVGNSGTRSLKFEIQKIVNTKFSLDGIFRDSDFLFQILERYLRNFET